MTLQKRLAYLMIIGLLSVLLVGGGAIPSAMADAPNAPTILGAQTISTTQITVTWKDNSNEETNYILQRTGGGTSIEITCDPNTQSYTDSGLTPSTEYTYRVRAFNGADYSEWSGTVSDITWGAPAAPTGLTTNGAPTATQVSLKWSDNSINESTFDIYRKTTDAYTSIGSVVANVTTYTDTNVSSNTDYTYKVVAANITGESESNELQVKTPQSAPAKPTGLTAGSITNTSLTLSWTDNSNNETGFYIYRNSVYRGIVGAGVTTYVDTGLTAGTTYSYKVVAYNDAGQTESDSISATTTGGVTQPTAPTIGSATVNSSSSITVTWTDNSSNETGFKIERKTGSSGTYVQIATRGAGYTSYTDTGLSASTIYYYRVRAYNSAYDSAYSGEVHATTSASSVPNAAPYNLVLSSVTSSQIKLTWSQYSSNEDGFKIERKTGYSGSWSEIYTAGANVTTYTNTGLSASTTYYYRVRAYIAGGGYSDYTSEEYATTLSTYNDKPSAPDDFTATASSSYIYLTWDDNSNNEDGFKIFRKESSDSSYPTSATKTVSANVESWTDYDVEPGVTYNYKIYAYNDEGNSAYDTVTVTASSSANAPKAPSGLDASVLSSTEIKLTWEDNSSNESGFKIERKVSGGTFSQIGTVGSGVVTYSDYGLTANTTYYYRVKAYNNYGSSSYCSEDSATTSGSDLSKPAGLTGYASGSSIYITWTDNNSSETGYRIERKTGSGGVYSEIGTVAANTSRYTDSNVTEGTTYYYRVRAYNSYYYSGYSNETYITATGGGQTPSGSKVLLFYIGNRAYFTNGVPSVMDSAAIIKNGRTLLPITYVGTSLGASVKWSKADQKVTVTLGSKVIEMWIGKSAARVNGQYKLIDPSNSKVVPIIVSGRTMLPVRFITENLNCKVEWNKNLQEVKITY